LNEEDHVSLCIQRLDKLEKLFEELRSKHVGIPLEKERMVMVGGRVEHNPLSYTLFYEAKTEEAENYSHIFTCMKIFKSSKSSKGSLNQRASWVLTSICTRTTVPVGHNGKHQRKRKRGTFQRSRCECR